MTSIIGYYTTPFGELWNKSLFDLVEDVIFGVLKNAKLEQEKIDAVFFGNMMAGALENNLHSPSKIAEIMGSHIPVFRAEAACASGGAAFYLALKYLEAGAGKTVMVIGAEKMTDYSPEETVSALVSASSGEEQESGLTFPGLYALMAQIYLTKYNYSKKELAYVSYKNHFHGSLNENAHFRKKIRLEDILSSPFVAYPLGVLDCSPISDGASAIILTSDKKQRTKQKYVVQVLASSVATDTISLKKRKYLDGIEATKLAADRAFHISKIKREEISVAEVHDCFSIAELFAMEDLGFWKKGDAGKRIGSLETMLGSGAPLIVNTSGGLKAAGHPVGATGVKQIGEIYLQLTGQAAKRQVRKARKGLTHNIGGSGGTAIVSIFGV
ncbi:MAG: thiolase domain-containing protein [Patescibacteria group bacterium]